MPPGSKKLKSLHDRMPIWVQNVMSSGYGAITAAKLSSPPFRRLTRELGRSQWLAPDELRAQQLCRLQALLRCAYAYVPYYRQALNQAGVHPQDVQSLSDLATLPLLEKETVRSCREQLVASTADRKRLALSATSGTTGSPLGIYWDLRVWQTHRAAIWRCRSWAGYRLGNTIATFTGMPVVPLSQRRPPFWRYDLPEARTLFSVFHLSQDNLEHYTRELKRLRPEYIEGYPSVLLILARYLEATGDALPVRAVFTGSEPLLPEHRETIERRFQARAFDYYGLAEGVASAGQCECLNGYHVTMESVVVEVVNARGETVRPGELGEVVGTSLTNLSMPLIRYRTGDIGALRAEGCACGRGLALMNQVVTKCEDIITTPEGRFISPSALTYPFKPIHAIEKSQIVQVARDHIVIRIVRRSGYTEADSARLLAGLRERLGGAIRLDLEFVEDIPRTALGKYRFVISQVPLEVR